MERRRLKPQSSGVIQKLTSFFTVPSSTESTKSILDGSDALEEKSKLEKPKSRRLESWLTSVRESSRGFGRNTSALPWNKTERSAPVHEKTPVEQPTPSSLTGRRSLTFDLSRHLATHASEAGTTTSVGLLPSFFVAASAGISLKSGRFRVISPEEYEIECVPLKNEFKSPHFLPGSKGKLIGRGTTADVRLMLRRGGSLDELYAVKEFRGKEIHEKEKDYVRRVKSEYSIAKSLDHPNIITTVRLCTSRGRWNHVMEYCDQGDLFTLISERSFADYERLSIWKQLLRGVNYLHSHGIAHRDIKLENLLLTSSGCLKIIDFGVAEVFSGEHPGYSAGGICGNNMGAIRKCAPGICGSMPYMAPEVLANKGEYDPRPLDVWSCAIVFFTVRFGGYPWHGANPADDNYDRFERGWNDWLSSHSHGKLPNPSSRNAEDLPKCGPLFETLRKPTLKWLLLKMLHPQPEQRASISNVINTGFVRQIDCPGEERLDERFSRLIQRRF